MKRSSLIKIITIVVAVTAIYIAFDISRSVTQYNRGTTHLAEQRYDRAIACFDKAIERQSDFPEAYCNRGTAYYEMQRHDEAIRDFNRAIELRPEFAEAYYNRAMVYYHKRQNEAALNDFEKAQSLGHYVAPDVFEALGENPDEDR